MSYKLAEDATRLYRYVNADLLWGLNRWTLKYEFNGSVG